MVDFNFVMEYIDEIKNITDINTLSDHFTNTIKKLGFNQHMTSSTVDLARLPENSILVSHYPEEWANRYLEKEYYNFDDVVKSTFNQIKPYIWNDKNRDKINQKIFSEAGEFGIVSGITIPIYVEGFYPSTVNISSDQKSIAPVIYHALHLIAIHYHDKILKIHNVDSTKRVVLTNRQRQCLQWAAAGKSYNDIGDILSISSRTVQYHISKTMVKFGVVSHEQAIAKATSMGLIHP